MTREAKLTAAEREQTDRYEQAMGREARERQERLEREERDKKAYRRRQLSGRSD